VSSIEQLKEEARAFEQKDTALEFYDRVFTLDINFADITERLLALRS